MSKFISCIGENEVATLVNVENISYIAINGRNGKNWVYNTNVPLEISFKELSLIGKVVDVEDYFERSTPKNELIFKKHISHIIGEIMYLTNSYSLEIDSDCTTNVAETAEKASLFKIVDNKGVACYVNIDAIQFIFVEEKRVTLKDNFK